MAGPEETGITNLGPVPDGLTFFEATAATIGARKFTINPQHRSGRLTLCEAAREIWREADRIGGAEGERLKVLAGAVFDYGKRMDARMKQLKRGNDSHGL